MGRYNHYYEKFTEAIKLKCGYDFELSALPEVRGTADTDGGAYSPFRSILLVLTHDFIIIQLYGPACGDGWEGYNDADRCCALF